MELLVNMEEREQYLYHIVSANLSLNSILFFLFFCTTIQQIKNNSARSKLDTVLIVLSGLLSAHPSGPLSSLAFSLMSWMAGHGHGLMTRWERKPTTSCHCQE